MSNDGYMEFGFDSGDENIGKKAKRFKGKEGETYRTSFVWTRKNKDGDKVVRFLGCERNYLAGVGYFLNKGAEYSRLAGQPAKQAVSTIIVSWPMNSRGRLDAERFKKGEGWEVMPWVFSATRYDQLRRRNDQFPLTEFDLSIKCEDTQYQKMDLSACKESLFLRLRKSEKDNIRAMVDAINLEVEELAKTLQNDMARDMTLDQIREKMGGAGGSPVTSSGSVEDVDGLLDDLLEDED